MVSLDGDPVFNRTFSVSRERYDALIQPERNFRAVQGSCRVYLYRLSGVSFYLIYFGRTIKSTSEFYSFVLLLLHHRCHPLRSRTRTQVQYEDDQMDRVLLLGHQLVVVHASSCQQRESQSWNYPVVVMGHYVSISSLGGGAPSKFYKFSQMTVSLIRDTATI